MLKADGKFVSDNNYNQIISFCGRSIKNCRPLDHRNARFDNSSFYLCDV